MDIKVEDFQDAANYSTCWLAPALTALYIYIFIKLRGAPMDTFMVAILLLYWVTITMNMVQKFLTFEKDYMMDVIFSVIGLHIVWFMLSILVFEMLRFKYVLTFNNVNEQVRRARIIKICKYVVGVITII
jgi:hypothetical protein